jgi:hypothetical protein
MLTTDISAQMGGAGPGSSSINVRSGERHRVLSHSLPHPIRVVVRPKNGSVTLSKEAGRTVIYYQSRRGYVGPDSFTYIRISNDRFGGTYAVAVTVR